MRMATDVVPGCPDGMQPRLTGPVDWETCGLN